MWIHDDKNTCIDSRLEKQGPFLSPRPGRVSSVGAPSQPGLCVYRRGLDTTRLPTVRLKIDGNLMLAQNICDESRGGLAVSSGANR
jgi:hypothetical protein